MRKLVLETVTDVVRETHGMLEGPNVAVSGGSTYATLFEGWGKLGKLDNIEFFPVDERRVPYDDPRSNWKMTVEKLLIPAGLGKQKANRAESRQQYEQLLKQAMGESPRFDQVWLGVGEDGHTASLFPGELYLEDTESLVLETLGEMEPKVPRVTLGMRAIWEARQLYLVVIGGGSKGKRIQELFLEDESLPITRALKGHPDPMVILDEETQKAVSQLQGLEV